MTNYDTQISKNDQLSNTCNYKQNKNKPQVGQQCVRVTDGARVEVTASHGRFLTARVVEGRR